MIAKECWKKEKAKVEKAKDWKHLRLRTIQPIDHRPKSERDHWNKITKKGKRGDERNAKKPTTTEESRAFLK
jgi:hypothetical protein